MSIADVFWLNDVDTFSVRHSSNNSFEWNDPLSVLMVVHRRGMGRNGNRAGRKNQAQKRIEKKLCQTMEVEGVLDSIRIELNQHHNGMF